jgi:AAA ATPase domain
MKLRRFRVEGYRSIRHPLDVEVDGRVTVLLGANDHGKTNLIEAMLHLNDDWPFEATDLNWDCAADSSRLPQIQGEFELDDHDRKALAAFEDGVKAAEREKEDPAAADWSPVNAKAVPKTLVVERTGLSGSLDWKASIKISSEAMASFLAESFPRFEIFRPVDTLPDAATAANIIDDAHEFMRGIFFLANLEPPWDPFFTKNNATARRLDRASEKLNEVLRQSWTQGADLTFHLRHDSAKSEIEIMVEDPAVTEQYVRVSRRSAGFTNFFGLKTTLHAREQASEANSYVWLFDEPGLSLHPAGQQDLLQAIEGIGRSNQVVYTTHSLFLINKNFPARHRLIVKTERGTQVDSKPFVGRWRSAIEALGLSLPGTILFAGQVLLAEGDTDGILLLGALQALIEQGQLDVDLNALSVVGTGDSAKAFALIELLTEARPTPKIAVLVDGDQGGRDRLKELRPVLDRLDIPSKALPDGTTIEDHLPSLELYVRGAARWAVKVARLKGAEVPGPIEDELLSRFAAAYPAPERTKGVAEWARKEAAELAGVNGKLSKLGISREYVNALLEPGARATAPKRIKEIAKWLQESVGLPVTAASETEILDDQGS